jgi:glycerophosphoryl diester phosphodiesterase
MRILGHRGASADAPENTLAAFTLALEQGADGVELDVMRCGSGELVVCHDEWLDRLAWKHWEVAATPLWKLRTADVGTPLGFSPARIPTLEEVFDALPARAVVNVELKCETFDDRGLSVAVGDFVTERRLESRVFLSSFNPLCLVRVARSHPALRRGLLIDPDRPVLLQLYGWAPLTARTSIHPYWRDCTPERVARWHEWGLEVAVWTVDDVAEARRLEAMGVDWVISNRPGALRRELAD